ncbi:MAG: SDR family oxidoreductase [Isosphaeraceae bacterium]
MSTLIVGCGYLGQRVGNWLSRRGEDVYGTVRSPRRAEEIARLGITPIIADVLRPDSLTGLPEARRVLYCVGYDRRSGADRRAVYVDGLRNVLQRLPGSVSRVVYTSSTSVYGQTRGEWIDEDSATEPETPSGRICLEAENVLRGWPARISLSRIILRFSGLYGPGRVIRRALLEQGEPIPGEPDRFLNVIHIDDAAQAAVAALDAARPEPVYVVSDDHPVPRREYYALAARLLNAPPPQFIPAAGHSVESRGDTTNRRVLNRRMRDRLGVDLIYPDITSGLPARWG